MKKYILILALVISLAVSAIAQRTDRYKAVRGQAVTLKETSYVEKVSPSTFAVSESRTNHKSKDSDNSINKSLIGSARNIFGGLLSYQSCLTVNPVNKIIMFTHRGNEKGTLAPLATGNDIVAGFSADFGETFTQKIVLSDADSNRFPNGVLFNPAGTHDTASSYYLVAGPIINNNICSSMFLHTRQFNGNNENHQELATDLTYLELMRNGLTATNDGKFHIGAVGTIPNPGQTGIVSCKLFQLNGSWNSTNHKVDWGAKVQITPDLVTAPSDNTLYLNESFSQVGWSLDGSTGYLVILGADNRPTDKPSIAPIIWKTTDGGTTWNIMEYFDWGSLPEIRDNIFPTKSDTTVYKPYFEEASVVVDKYNRPHIFGICRGGYSANLDSLSCVYVRASTGTIMDGNVVELYLDNSSSWKAFWVDSISADAVPPSKSPYSYSPENIGWNHRLTASTTFSGTDVFCTWTDSDWIFWGTDAYDYNPDLKGWNRGVDDYWPSYPENFTAGTDIWGMIFFHYTSQLMLPYEPGWWDNLEYPVVIADINTTGLKAGEPVYYYYLKDILATGCHENESRQNSDVSPCYPNPFKGLTKVDVTVAKASDVRISISDITGKLLSETDYGMLSPGKHSLTIDGRQLQTGIYLYTVVVDDQNFTNKMIVE